MIRLGLQLPVYRYPGLPDSQLFGRIVEVAAAAEASGFDSFFLMDHVQQIGGVGQVEDPMLEPYTLLGALAARTSRLTLGTLVTSVVYRNPALLAKMVTTLDLISGGRAMLGIGAGWYQDEAARYGYTWPSAGERLDRLEDTLRICRAMFTDATATVEGRHHSIRDALNNPRPIQSGGPKILVGGGGERRTLRLAAQYADACNVFDSLAVVRRKLAILAEHCRAIGRNPAEITKTRLAMLVISPTQSEANDRLSALLAGMPSPLPKEQLARLFIAGDPDAVCAQVQAHVDAGIDGLIFSLPQGATPDEVALAGRTLATRFGLPN
ncbi:MAG: LLM class F420-dependent oxidoreductase [Chloroflexota bacterium]